MTWPVAYLKGVVGNQLSGSFQEIGGEIVHVDNYESLRMGPYSPNSIEEEGNWQKYWHLNKWDIDYHLANYGNTGYYMHPDIATWPAHGDTTLGESFDLAPFEDYNSNGIYDPENGDYPLIKGTNCVYMIMNDIVNGTVGGQLSEQLNIEVHKMIYSMDCAQDSALAYSVFFETRVINKGATQIDEFTQGAFLDMDIGNALDDYIGTDVMKGMVFGYNGSLFDPSGNGQLGYGNYIPAQGYSILKGMKKELNGIDDGVTHFTNGSYNGFGFDDGITDNEYFGLTASMYVGSSSYSGVGAAWNYSNATNQVFGVSNYPANFCFPGDSDPLFYGAHGINPGAFVWSEDSVGNVPGDRRIVAATKGGTLYPGDETSMTSMYTYARDFTTPGRLESVAKLKSFVDDVRGYFTANQTPCGQTFDYYNAGMYLAVNEEDKLDLIKVFPNPSKAIFKVQLPKLVNPSIQIYDLTGKLLLEKNSFGEQTEINLGAFQNGIYLMVIHSEEGRVVRKLVKE